MLSHELVKMLDEIGNIIITDSFQKADSVLNAHEIIMVSISGGADSDIMLDLLWRLDDQKKLTYVFFDTGLEFIATREHLNFLEEKYGIEIQRFKAVKPIPVCAKEYGIPFLTKDVSQRISYAQRHGFDFGELSQMPYEEFVRRYENTGIAFREWWYNRNKSEFYRVENKVYLKEFLVMFPSSFQISDKCCDYAKKMTALQAERDYGVSCYCTGIRKAEGGIRSQVYKNCYSVSHGIMNYRPLFWYTAQDRRQYEDFFEIVHSRCYTEYHMKRTGCAGCPINFRAKCEIQKEPQFARAAWRIFGQSFAYRRKYDEFKARMRELDIPPCRGDDDVTAHIRLYFKRMKGEVK